MVGAWWAVIISKEYSQHLFKRKLWAIQIKRSRGNNNNAMNYRHQLDISLGLIFSIPFPCSVFVCECSREHMSYRAKYALA